MRFLALAISFCFGFQTIAESIFNGRLVECFIRQAANDEAYVLPFKVHVVVALPSIEPAQACITDLQVMMAINRENISLNDLKALLSDNQISVTMRDDQAPEGKSALAILIENPFSENPTARFERPATFMMGKNMPQLECRTRDPKRTIFH